MTDLQTRLIILDEKITANANERMRVINFSLTCAAWAFAIIAIITAHKLSAVPHSVEQVKLMQENVSWK